MKMTGLRLIGLNTIDLPLFGAQPTDQFILKVADGLGPVGRDVSFARGVFKRAENQDREIVIRIGLNPNWFTGQTASELRDLVYGLLSDGITELVDVRVMDGVNAVARTSGVVRLIEIVPFSKDPEVQLTILCGDPYLYATAERTVSIPTGTSAPQIDIEGGLPQHFYFYGEMTASASYFSMHMQDSVKNLIRIDVAVNAGTQIIIDTRPGTRSIRVGIPFTTEQGTTYQWTNQIDAMTADSVWARVLHGQDRVLHLSQPVVYASLKYWPIYRGI